MRIRILLSILICTLLSLSSCKLSQDQPTATPVPPANEPAGSIPASSLPGTSGNRLFFDDFQDGNPDGWKINAGWDIQQNGDVYLFTSSVQGSAFVQQGTSWRNYALVAAIRLDSGSLVTSFMLTKNGRYYLNYREDGLVLAKEISGTDPVVLGNANPPALATWHWLLIAISNGHIQVYVDRVAQLDYIDSNPLQAGTIGFGIPANSQAAVDNILVTELTGALPAVSIPQAQQLPASGAPPAAPPLPPDLPSGGEEPPPSQPNNPPSNNPAVVTFLVEGTSSATIDPGQCVTTEWNVQNALEVYYQGQAVGANGSNDECPAQTTTYVLEVTGLDGNTSRHTVTVNVSGGGGNNPPPPTGRPDITITNTTFPISSFSVGEPVSFDVTVSNNGDAPTGAFTVIWYPFGSGAIGCSYDLNSIIPTGSMTFDCDYAGYPNSGTFNWRLIADSENEVAESNENNNTYNGTVKVTESQQPPPPPQPGARLPDLIISAVNLQNPYPVGTVLRLGVAVYNQGEAPAGPFTLVWLPGTGQGIIGCSWDLDSLGQTSGLTLTCEFPGYPSTGSYNWIAIADSEKEIAESNETNNTMGQEISIVH